MKQHAAHSLRRSERLTRPVANPAASQVYRPYNRVHQLHRHLEAVFSLPEASLDAERVQWLERAQAERARHRGVIATVRQALLDGHGLTSASSELTAEAGLCLGTMLDIAQEELTHDLGPAPGRFAIMALGKLGGGELTLSSDLDLLFVYQPSSDADDHAAAEYFAKLGQHLVKLLSWAPEWKETYEVDLRLRPHGQKGPIAVPLSGLTHYLNTEGWTWELQAATRLRPVAGDPALGEAVLRVARDAIRTRIDPATIGHDVADMRCLMGRERPASSVWDLKLSPGGLVDIEFLVQALQLAIARQTGFAEPNTGAALAKLADLKVLDRRTAQVLRAAWSFYTDIRHVQSALGCDDLSRLSDEDANTAAAALGYKTLAAIEKRVVTTLGDVRDIFNAILSRPSVDQANARPCFKMKLNKG